MTRGITSGQWQQVMAVADAVRIVCQGGEALADHRLPLLIAGNGIRGPFDLDIHLQPGCTWMLGHRALAWLCSRMG